MITQEQVRNLIGSNLVDSNGDKIGKIGQIFLDDRTGHPEWATVNTGFFGSSENFVPLAQAAVSGEELRVPFDKAKVKDAPNVDVERGHLDEPEEQQLYAYYGLDYSSGLDQRDGIDTSRGAGHDVSGPNTDDAMTRSEERLSTGTEAVATQKARLRKWVETEQQQITVPVAKEKAKLVTEPITDGNVGQATDGPAISEEEYEVTLTEERPVVTKEAVPVERVGLEKETEIEQATVTDEVRKERIGTDGDGIDLTSDRSDLNR